MSENPYDNDYQLAITVIQRPGKIENWEAKTNIVSTLDHDKYVLTPESQFTMLDTSYTLAGNIDANTGLAIITGEANDADYKLEEGNWLFAENQFGYILSGSMLFDGGYAIGFYFFTGGFPSTTDLSQFQKNSDSLI